MPSLILLILRSQNLEALLDFYTSLLAISFEEHTDHGPQHYGAQVGEVYLELYPTKQEQRPLDGLGFSVSNLEAALANIDQKYIRRQGEDTPFGKRATLTDPDGRFLYVKEMSQEPEK
ncbi:MAG TPA: VOC family protein [Candidatus Nanoarchaeia archaeon]|nr:VOC family protein [Candidatus Nanoarchaeia archaeon]